MSRLTKRVVDGASPKESEFFIWDGELPGFGLRVFPSGRKSYLVQYRSGGRTRRIKIGLHGPTTPDAARVKALSLLAEVANGGNPAETSKLNRVGLTVSELCDAYVKTGMGLKKRTTVATDLGRIERHIKPLLGTRLAANVTQADVQKFVRDVSSGKTAANVKTRRHGLARVTGGAGTAARTLGLLGGIFTFGIQSLDLRADNPVRGVTRKKDGRRVRFLSDDEFKRLGKALEDAESNRTGSLAVAAIRLLIMTGCRKSEILSLQWSFIDWDRRQFRLPDSKTGQKTVHVPPQALTVLKAIPKIEKSPFVLPTANPAKHYVGLQKDWVRLRTAAKIEDVRIHDLRHAFASTAAASGHSLLLIGRLLGHKDPRTTQIYAHLADQTLSDAVEKTAGLISGSMSVSNGTP